MAHRPGPCADSLVARTDAADLAISLDVAVMLNEGNRYTTVIDALPHIRDWKNCCRTVLECVQASVRIL